MLDESILDNDLPEDENISYKQIIKIEADLDILRLKHQKLLSLYDEFSEFLDTKPSEYASDIIYDHMREIEDLASSMKIAIDEMEYRFDCKQKIGFREFTPIRL